MKKATVIEQVVTGFNDKTQKVICKEVKSIRFFSSSRTLNSYIRSYDGYKITVEPEKEAFYLDRDIVRVHITNMLFELGYKEGQTLDDIVNIALIGFENACIIKRLDGKEEDE